jgi:transcriptional regulator with XRE-family HTH domain
MSQHTIECTSATSSSPVSRIRRAADYSVVQAERAAAQLLRASRMATGTQEELSKASGVSRARWQSWECEDESTSINAARILAAAYSTQAGKAFAIDLLERILDHVHREAGEPSGLSIERLVDVAHAEMGELSIAWREARADGVISADERRQLLGKVRGLVGAVRKLEAMCEEVDHG